MNRAVFAIPALFSLLLLSLISCKKNCEVDVKAEPEPKVEEPCLILSFESYEKMWNGSYDTITTTFKYDHRRNPVSITFNKNTTGRSNQVFKYDQDGRLIVHAGLWPGYKSFDFYHKFGMMKKATCMIQCSIPEAIQLTYGSIQ